MTSHHQSSADDADHDTEARSQSSKRKRDADKRAKSNAGTSSMRKRDFWSGLTRFLDAFFRKDAYGFFHEPVDTTLVTDYLTVIREPMDLTTMRNKVQQQVYTTLDEFRSDIKLICDNARIYNKPDTIYYREASRLWEYADRVLTKSGSHLHLPGKEEESEPTTPLPQESFEWNRKQVNEEEVDVVGILADSQPISKTNSGTTVTTSEIARTSTSNAEKTSSYTAINSPPPAKKPAYHNIRRRKYVDASFRTLADGSFKEFQQDQWLASLPDYGQLPTIKVTSNVNKSNEIIEKQAGLLDYGPFARLTPKNPPPTADRAMYLFSSYGDEIGEAYARSLEAFTCDMDDDVKLIVHERLNRLSEGAHAIVHQVVNIAAAQQTKHK